LRLSEVSVSHGTGIANSALVELERFRWWVAAVAAALMLLVTTAAEAQHTNPYDKPYFNPWLQTAERVDVGPEEAREQRLHPAAAMTGMSFGVMSAGLVTYIVSRKSEESCGLTGCFTHANPQLEVAAGALAAAGGGMALVAVPTLIDAMFVDRGAPRNPGRNGWGMALTSLGVGSAASLGFLALALHRSEEERFNMVGQQLGPSVDEGMIITMMIAQGLSAATYLGVGIPLWAAGGRAHEEAGGWPATATIVPSGTGAALNVSF
jgi:hypothetical protein